MVAEILSWDCDDAEHIREKGQHKEGLCFLNSVSLYIESTSLWLTSLTDDLFPPCFLSYRHEQKGLCVPQRAK